MTDMTTQERIRRMYAHKEADRIPIMDSPWPETIRRWVDEGMTTEDYVEYFDLDRTAYISTDNSPRLPEKEWPDRPAPNRRPDPGDHNPGSWWWDKSRLRRFSPCPRP